MKRLFFALWPDQQTRQQCVRLMENIKRCGGHAVCASNLHVTLVFLGNVGAGLETSIIRTASGITMQNFVITFDCLSYWRKPRVLCLTAQAEPVAELVDLAGRIKRLAINEGLSVDDRPLNPHVTLFRKARYSIQEKFEPIVWRAESFVLVESCSLPESVQYRVLQNFNRG